MPRRAGGDGTDQYPALVRGDPMTTGLLSPENSLDALANEINLLHDKAERHATTAVVCAARCGDRLLKAKAQVAHGQWLDWLAGNCRVKQSQAKKYMQLARGMPELLDPNRQSTGDFTGIEHALALLSADDDVKDEVKSRLASGETVSVKEIERLKREHGAPVTTHNPREHGDAESAYPNVHLRLIEDERPEHRAEHNHRTLGTGNNEWYTPQKYIDAARSVLGTIDLDPATSEDANLIVGASRIFTADDDGLSQNWEGNVWLNPPYSQPAISQFAEKLTSEFDVGRVVSAIALTHNLTDTAWFHRMAKSCSAICFTRGRIAFIDTIGNRNAPTQGQAFFYFGDDIRRFADVFSDIGIIVIERK